MSDAAKAARGAFNDVKAGADEMASGVENASARTEYSMTEARHGVMMLGEEFGVHLPRGLTTFIASLGPIGAAMEAAFPFLAIILGATLLIEHLVKVGEAAEKAAEAGHKLDDDMTLGVNHAKEALIDAAIEARKLAGEPAWDLIAKKLKLQDVDRGIENLHRLDAALTELAKPHGATSNWNPFNWLDHSDELASKIKSLQADMQGKSETDQAGVLAGRLASQSKILEQMRGQSDVSAAQLQNEEAYVAWLRQATTEIQTQVEAAKQREANKVTKDTQDRVKKAEEEQTRLYEAQQRGLSQRQRAEEEYYKKGQEAAKKALEDKLKLEDEEARATESVTKAFLDGEKEKARIGEELGKEEAEHTKKMASLELQAEETKTKDLVELHKNRSAQILAEQIAGEDAAYAAQLRGYETEIGSLDKNGKDYEVHLRQLQDREIELTKEHENKLAAIKEQAAEEQSKGVIAAYSKMSNTISADLTKTLMGQESWAKMSIQLGKEVASGVIENALKIAMAEDKTKGPQAAHAARSAYLAGQHFPFPIDLVAAPTLAAAAFAAVMAFEQGGIVPGVERGDVVQARLTPGEAVIPKAMTENLTHAARFGTGDQRPAAPAPNYHYHNHIHAVDGPSVERLLDEHGDKFAQKFHDHVRRGH
jgi:hypothetical protein